MPNFTLDQQRAIQEEGNIIVSAGAGSGKTAVLSERVLYFIKEKNYSISEFLILTFTNLAAGEMKSRIRQKLIDNNLKDKDFVDVSDITTFDAFSNKLVKQYHNLLGVDSNFTLIDSNIILVLKQKYIDEELEILYQQEDPLFLEFIDKYCYKDDNAVRALILQVLNQLDLSLNKEEFLSTFLTKYFSDKNIEDIFSYVTKKLIYERDKWCESITDVPDILDNKGNSLIEEYQKQIDYISQFDTYEEVLSSFINLETIRSQNKYKDLISEEENKAFDRFKKKRTSLKSYFSSFPSKEEGKKIILQSEKYVKLILSIVKKIDERIREYKFSHQSFEFSDIGNFALKLVRENKNIQEELKSKYKMIMIDEYQDTSELQEIFISYIQNNNVYCVGDIKQSIYGFRNARCDIFKNKYDLYQNNTCGKAIDLKHNFRSRREVLDNINLIFKNIMSDSLGGANYLKDHIIEYGNKLYLEEVNPLQDNNLEIYSYNDKNDEEKEIRIIALDIISKINSKYQVCEMKNDHGFLRPCEFKDFAIIIDRGNSFDNFIKIFNEYQIPLYVERDEDIKDNDLVNILKNLFIIIKYLRNNLEIDGVFKHAYVSVIRSFVFNYTDQDIYSLCQNNDFINDKVYLQIKEVINDNYDSSDYVLVNRIINDILIYQKVSRIGNIEINQSYLDSFISTFKQMNELDFSLDDFITYLDNINEYEGLKLNLSSKGTSINSVRLINIHKSKGLEFNIVYFPYLYKNFPSKEEKISLGYSKDFGIFLKEEGMLIKTSYLYKNRIETLSEKIRLLYVALTRAREKMILIMPKIPDYKELKVIDSKSFYDLIYPLKHFFKNVNCNNISNQYLVKNLKPVEKEKFSIKKIIFDKTLKEQVKRASKEISLEINKEALRFGNALHFALEITDFKNPDYSLISNGYVREKVKSFLSSPLMEDINNAKIYKEYEFIDSKNNTNGIIDLLLVYQDKVVIIDYKTKNIDDEKYNKQLEVYKDFVKQKYDLPIYTYLYSIVSSTSKEVAV
ncbi:MAG: UvrD-helicase domain-containing protein [Bacilli bacterium]|nr:UvrD-helicase domain-containing protein [Bacilli bacterium]